MKKMTEDLLNGRENWSDFEETISKLLEDRTVEIDEIEKCVDEFQAYFTRFLNNLVDSSVLLEMNADVKEKALAKQSLSHFMKDLPNTCDIKFPATTDHYDLYNFLFVDFCYTSLLDNYMYLDKGQFDPHTYRNGINIESYKIFFLFGDKCYLSTWNSRCSNVNFIWSRYT